MLSTFRTVGLVCVAIIVVWHVMQALRDRFWLADAFAMLIVGGLLVAWPSSTRLSAPLVSLALTLKLVGVRLRKRSPQLRS